MKTTFLSLFSLMIISNSFAGSDTLPTSTISKHQLGLNLGAATGMGLSYRYTPGRFMHQFTILPVARNNSGFIDFGYGLFYRVRERKYVNFNLYAGNHVMYTFEKEGNYRTLVNITGGGFGFDFKLGDYFSINLNGGLGVYNNGYTSYGSTYINTSMYPVGELGLFYKL